MRFHVNHHHEGQGHERYAGGCDDLLLLLLTLLGFNTRRPSWSLTLWRRKLLCVAVVDSDGYFEVLLSRTPIDAARGRYISVITPNGDPNVALARPDVVGGVDADPL